MTETSTGSGELVQRLCRFAVDEMGLSGCALVLMSGVESASVLAGAGRHARTVTGLQMELGEGPCLQAHASGGPVLLPDLAAGNAGRWPAFSAAALAAGVHAEFSLPLTVGGPGGIGTLDLCRDRPGMLSDEDLADALVAAEQAKGMLAEYLTTTVDDAFKLLRNYARYHNRKLSEVASDVVDRRIPSAVLSRPPGRKS